MRRFLAIVIAFQCARLVIAGTLPLTAKDIATMLRTGYSSDTILHDLSARHFAGPLDPSSESELQTLNASPALLTALKSGQFNASMEQLAQAFQEASAANVAAQASTEHERLALQAEEAGKSRARQPNSEQSTVENRGQKPARASNGPLVIDLEIGQSVDLRDFGANRKVIVNGVDMDAVLITLLDFDRMQIGGGGDVWSGISISSGPTVTHLRVKKEDKSVIYSWGRTKLVYLDVMDVAQNHIKLGIVSE